MVHFLALFLFLFSLMAAAGGRGLADRIPYPFYEVQENAGNKVMAIENGVAAFELRLQMIKRAQKNIEVEYFIYNTDLAGKIVTRELVAAAKRGVKVRILIDKNIATFQFHSFFAYELAQYGIEVKNYNTASIFEASTMQFRNHRKLLSVDDTEAITGGRNIAEDYFDMSPRFNFNDRDVYVNGPIVKAMRDSFDKFWEHKISRTPKRPKRPDGEEQDNEKLAWDTKASAAKSFLEESPEELLIRSRSADIGPKVLETYKMHDCPTTTFSTDAPGANFVERMKERLLTKYRYLRETLSEKTLEADKAFTLSSPYLIHNLRTKKIMNELVKNKVDIEVYTNSLGSTDAVYVAANLYLYIKSWAKTGMKIHLHDGKYLNIGPAMTEEAEKARWGTHDKTQVYESSHHTEVMIGTYNIDNRSNFYNTEMAIFCRGNDEFSQEVKSNILHRANSGILIQQDGKAIDKDGNSRNIYSASSAKVFVMKLITLPSWLLNFLL